MVSFMENKRLLVLLLIVVAVGAAVYYFYFMPQGEGSIETGTSSGNSETSISARPYIDYKTDDGRTLRVYLDDGSMYWVNSDGTLTPYQQRMLVWTVPGTMVKITQVQVGFELNLYGKYLKDQDSDGKQDITVTVTAKFKNNETGEYTVFDNQVFEYDIGDPNSGGSSTENIQSGYVNIDTIFSSVWGGSPSQDTTYWPYYYVSISVSAQSYWGDPMSASDQKTYEHTVIGDWQWKEAELSASLGSASAGTQSIIPLDFMQDPFTILCIIAIVIVAVIVISEWKRD